eukprot:285180_1
MSVARRDKGNDPDKPAPPNEDEGKLIENDHQRFQRTNQALKWAKGAAADAKLYIYAKTGQIEESEDSTDVTEAFQKLDTFQSQIDILLRNAETWTTSMLETWNYQTNLIDALNECNTVINTFHSRNNSPKNENENKNENNINNNIFDKDKNEFAELVKGISSELYLDQQESKRRYGHASKLLVVPLRNILNHEIAHACDIKRKYIVHKRLFDNCCTTITHLRNKIEDIENPKSIENNPQKSQSIGTFGKLKIGFNKLITSNPTKEDLLNKLSMARSELPQYIKIFDTAKQQLLEAINIVEEKLNVEVVYYVQQFYTFVQKWKSGQTPKYNSGNQNIGSDIGYSASADASADNINDINNKQTINNNNNNVVVKEDIPVNIMGNILENNNDINDENKDN